MIGTIQYPLTGRSAREIARSAEDGIRAGALRPGDALPTVRGLAAELAVSPATVAAAYRELARRGYVIGAGRGGTRVREAAPVSVRLPMTVPPGVRDLRSGGPDPTLLPEAFAFGPAARSYGEPSVSPRLSQVAAEQFAADGVDPRHLAVVGGALDGVERILGAWLHPGDRVVIEDPGYTAVLDLLGAMGFQAVPVDMDDRGARPDALVAALQRRVQAVLLTPRAQNPTGSAWDAKRARELHAVLAHHPDVLTIEDDHAGLAAGMPFSTVCKGRARWATVRSVSKWLGPDLRLALLAGDPTTVSRVEGRQSLGAGWVSYVLQDAVAAKLGDPATRRLLDRAASTYARRRRALAASLAAHGLEATGSSGLTTWVAVSDEHAVVAGLLQRGWAVSPGARFRIASPPGVRIAFATLDADDAARLAFDFAACVHQRPVRTG